MRCCVYTRVFYETPYLEFFIEHYINLEFDKIIILKSDTFEYNIPINLLSYVDIYTVKNEGNNLLKKNEDLIKNSNFDWVLSIDNDEILLLNIQYKNIKDYIEKHLDVNNNINIFYFRWAIIEKFDINNITKFSDILKKYKIYKNKHIKTMFNKKYLLHIYHPHLCSMSEYNIYFEGNILNENSPIIEFNNSSYTDHVLIHIHTRSINNLIIKSKYTVLNGKQIKDKQYFTEYINNIDVNFPIENITEKAKELIGLKSRLPFSHATMSELKINNLKTYDYNFDFVNIDKEKLMIEHMLNENNIDKTKYEYFINLLNNEINTKYRNLFYTYTLEDNILLS